MRKSSTTKRRKRHSTNAWNCDEDLDANANDDKADADGRDFDDKTTEEQIIL